MVAVRAVQSPDWSEVVDVEGGAVEVEGGPVDVEGGPVDVEGGAEVVLVVGERVG